MSYRCCVPNCRTGYGAKKARNLHLFRIPEADYKLFEKAIPRANFRISPSTRICSLHFDTSCFDYSSTDTNPSREKSTLKNPRLKTGSIPTMFLNCPSYLSRPAPTPRTTATSSRYIDQFEPSAVSELFDSLNETDRIENLKSIMDFKEVTSNSSYALRDEELLTIYIHDEQHHRILGRMEISSDFTFNGYILDSVINAEEFNHLLSVSKHVTYFTELSNCLTVIKTKRNCLTQECIKNCLIVSKHLTRR